MSCVSLCVLVVLLVLLVPFDMFDGCSWYLLLVVVYAWRLYWSCLGVCDRRPCCPLLICLCWFVLHDLFVVFALFDG